MGELAVKVSWILAAVSFFSSLWEVDWYLRIISPCKHLKTCCFYLQYTENVHKVGAKQYYLVILSDSMFTKEDKFWDEFT